MPNTLNRNYPWPAATQTADPRLDLQRLAEAVDTDVAGVHTRVAAMEQAPMAVYRRSGINLLANGQFQAIPLTLESENRGGWVLGTSGNSTTTGRVRVPQSGLYSIDGATRIQAVGQAGRRMLRLTINSSTSDSWGRIMESPPTSVGNSGSILLAVNNVRLQAGDELAIDGFTEHAMTFSEITFTARKTGD